MSLAPDIPVRITFDGEEVEATVTLGAEERYLDWAFRVGDHLPRRFLDLVREAMGVEPYRKRTGKTVYPGGDPRAPPGGPAPGGPPNAAGFGGSTGRLRDQYRHHFRSERVVFHFTVRSKPDGTSKP